MQRTRPKQRAWGTPGARRTHGLACKGRKHASWTADTPVHPAFPHAMVLTVSFVISPVTGLDCHRRRRNCMPETRLGRHAFRHLDASVGASGPHDFAVRKLHHSSARRSIAHRPKGPALPSHAALTQTASTASRPAFRDDRERPSVGRDGEGYAGDLGEKRSGIFLRKGMDGRISSPTLLQNRVFHSYRARLLAEMKRKEYK